jgi:DNA-directed RNA polymerase specialized sigma24 family protein
MPTTTRFDPTLFGLLEREWALLERSHDASTALRKWGSEDRALSGFDCLPDLMAPAGSTRHRASDEALAALVRRAAVDDLAARVVLQLILPGLKALARRYRWVGDAEEVAAAAVAAAYERIRTFPIERRPARIAANLVEDTRQHLWRRAKREENTWGDPLAGVDDCQGDSLARAHPVASAVWPSVEDAGAEELPELLQWALDEGHLSADAVDLILCTRAHDVPIAELCERSGDSAQTIRRRRLRAEDRLRAAVAAAA